MKSAAQAAPRDITSRGDVPEHAREAARAKVRRLDRLVKGPVPGGRVELVQEHNPGSSYPRGPRGSLTRRVPRARACHGPDDGCRCRRTGRAPASPASPHRRANDHRQEGSSPPGEWRHGTRRKRASRAPIPCPSPDCASVGHGHAGFLDAGLEAPVDRPTRSTYRSPSAPRKRRPMSAYAASRSVTRR